MTNKQFLGKTIKYARRVPAETLGTCRRAFAPANYGFIVLFALVIMTVVLTALGFAFQGSASAPAQVPAPPSLFVSFVPGSEPPKSLSIQTFLEHVSGPNRLIIVATGTFARNQASTEWELDVRGFTGHLCPGQPSLHLATQQGTDNYYLQGRSVLPLTSGTAFLFVNLCWHSNSPLITSGSYVSAALSPILAPSGQSGTVTRSLVLSGSSLSSYSLAGGVPPTEASAHAWLWSSSLGDEIQDQSRFEIPIIASSLPGLQRDNQKAFYSGIFFGIAGGAAVSIIPALLDAVDRHGRRKKNPRNTGDSQLSDRPSTVDRPDQPPPGSRTTTPSPSLIEQPRCSHGWVQIQKHRDSGAWNAPDRQSERLRQVDPVHRRRTEQWRGSNEYRWTARFDREPDRIGYESSHSAGRRRSGKRG
jgi:hypothetical protein